MDFFVLPGSAHPLLMSSCLGNEDAAAAGRRNVCEERRPGVWGQDVDSVSVHLLPCPEMLEAAERVGSAGCVRLQPASVQLQTHQPPLPLEEVVWSVVCEEMRCCLRPGNYHEVPCFPPGSADGFHSDEPLAGAERIWIAGHTLLFLAVVLVEVWEEYAKAKKEKEQGD